MTAARPIDFDHLGIGQVLKRHRLCVPLHQREYSWTEKEVTDLFQDLTNAVNKGKKAYFLGTIVLTAKDDKQVQVIDGQQRLATTCILIAAIRDYLYELDDDVLVTALEEFLFTIVRSTKAKEPRLALNVEDNEYFRCRILLRPDDKMRRKIQETRQSHRLIDDAAQRAAIHIGKILESLAKKHHIDQLNQWVDFIEESAQVIVAIPPDEINAFVMFETLNDRGLRTSQADLLKNFLFQQSENRIDEAQAKWSTMRGTIEALDDDLTLTYLRHLTIARYGYTREREVLERIRENVTSKVQAISFLDGIAESATDYVALMTPDHATWNKYAPSIRRHVHTLAHVLKVTPMRPIMLAVLHKFSKAEVERAFRSFVCWSVRFLIAGGLRSGATEESYAMAAYGVSRGDIKTAEQLLDSLMKVLPADGEFSTAFSTKRVSQVSLARYYLRAMELKLQGNPEPEWIPNEDVVITLEHVLPQRPDEGGWETFDADVVQSFNTRLGNLALLKASKNSDADREPFATKKLIYAESTFKLTKEIAKYKVWDIAAIEARQKKMAELAVLTWPLRP